MEDKKLVYIIGLTVVIMMIMTAGVFLFLYWPKPLTPEVKKLPEINTNTTIPSLPSSGDTNLPGQSGNSQQSELEKEKQFISSFWEPIEIQYLASAKTYELPINKIKEQITNYRDFSRKIDLESSLDKLSNNGFVVIDNPFDSKVADWESNYQAIKKNNLPVFVSADSLAGFYQDTLHIIYKEVEEEIFYPSLWHLLEEMFNQVKRRYGISRQQFGIETNTIAEANRLELAYLTVALKLLQPEIKQVKEPLTTNRKFFSPQEASIYSFSVPDYLTDEIEEEIKLIKDHKDLEARSPVFLYQANYQDYEIPTHYRTSEILKNYYLAITWLNNSLFPLWSEAADCPSCILDQQDHLINFTASLYLSNDLASNQNFKNRWANIYKSISFFKGLETNLTYLSYQRALKEIFGEDYDLNEIFGGDLEKTKERIAQLQQKIDGYTFPTALGGDKKNKDRIGLKLLRDYHLLENKLFTSLIKPNAGEYLGQIEGSKTLPFTICAKTRDTRCLPTGLDLFNLLKNPTAKEILAETKDDLYQNYQQNIDDFTNKTDEFDQYTWHDNSYLALLLSLQSLYTIERPGLPTFMTTEAWAKKTLNTGLAIWVESHREINFEKTGSIESGGLVPYFPYGYVEPQIEFYSQLLSNIEMVMNGFTSLRIISTNSKSYERLENLKIIFQKVIAISRKQLENIPIGSENYSFINNFDKQISAVIGDIKKENVQNNYSFNYTIDRNNTLSQHINGLDYIIVVYPDPEGKLFLATGPVFNYTEDKGKKFISTTWQEEFKE